MPRIYKRAEHLVDDGATDVRPCDQDGATNAPTQGSSRRKSRAKGYHDESCDWQGPQVTRRVRQRTRSTGGGEAAEDLSNAHDTASDLPDGPSAMSELMVLPTTAVDALIGDGAITCNLLPRLQNIREAGLNFYTDYSCFECPRWAWAAMEKALSKHDNECAPPLPGTFHRTCDISPLPSSVCREIHARSGQGCHFGNITTRLPQAAQDYLEAAAPDPGASNEEKKEAHHLIGQWLLDNRQWCFDSVSSSTSKCQVHEKLCPTWPSRPQGSNALNINVSCVTCVAWSMRGKRTGASHSSEIPFHIWIAERLFLAEQDAEDVAMMECVAGFPRDRLTSTLSATHHIVWVICGPEDKGWPTSRKRLLAAVINKKRWRWVGPPTPELLADEYRRRCFWSRKLAGESLFFESEQDRFLHYADVVNARPGQKQSELTVDDLHELPEWELLMLLGPPGLTERVSAWKKKFSLGIGQKESFILDADHWPKFGGRGTLFPTQITHSTIMFSM